MGFFKYGNRIAAGMRKNDPSSGHHPSAVQRLSGEKHGKASFGITVGVVDERSELGACFQGVPQNDLGMRTDILDGCPKSQGMMMLIRSMAPAVIAVDEIGGKEDIRAVEYIRSCGCGLAAAVHGVSLKEVEKRPGVGELFKEGTFKRLIFLDQAGGAGHICAVYDGAGRLL